MIRNTVMKNLHSIQSYWPNTASALLIRFSKAINFVFLLQLNQRLITLANNKTNPVQLLTTLGPDWCAEHDGVFRFSRIVLVFP